jgi:hypothetical protein
MHSNCQNSNFQSKNFEKKSEYVFPSSCACEKPMKQIQDGDVVITFKKMPFPVE